VELIKSIKDTEKKADEIIEQARSEVSRQRDELRQNRIQAFEEAEQRRSRAIEDAVEKAEQEGRSASERLREQAEQKRRLLAKKAAGRMDAALEKVLGSIKG